MMTSGEDKKETKNNWLHLYCPLTHVSLRRSCPRRLRCRILAHDVDGSRPSLHCASWRCFCCSRPAPAPAGGTSWPSGRCSLCREGMQLCSGSAPSPPSWANVWCHSWPRTEVVYSLHWPGHHHLRSPRVQARGAERGVHRRSCRRRGRRDVRQGMIPAMATGVLVFDLLKLSRSPSDDENCLQVQMGKPNIDARKFLSEAISLKSKGIDGAYKSAA